MVTSSAVVGSSAMSSDGSQASAMAIIARWRMPPLELVRVVVARARPASGDAHELQQLHGALARPPAPVSPRWVSSASVIWRADR